MTLAATVPLKDLKDTAKFSAAVKNSAKPVLVTKKRT
jgi:hypothetical protein